MLWNGACITFPSPWLTRPKYDIEGFFFFFYINCTQHFRDMLNFLPCFMSVLRDKTKTMAFPSAAWESVEKDDEELPLWPWAESSCTSKKGDKLLLGDKKQAYVCVCVGGLCFFFCYLHASYKYSSLLRFNIISLRHTKGALSLSHRSRRS